MRSERHLEVNIGAKAQELAEVRVPEDGAPFARPVLGDAGLERGLFLRRPALLRRPHPQQIGGSNRVRRACVRARVGVR